jgi:hypothetical protein
MTVVAGIFGSCDRDFFPENDIACDGNYGKYKSVAIGVIILIVCCAVLNRRNRNVNKLLINTEISRFNIQSLEQ